MSAMTRMSRRASRRPVARISPFAAVASLGPALRVRAADAVLSGANTSSVPNIGSIGGALTVTTGTLAAPVASALFKGKPVFTFTGAQRMASSLAASLFKFEHDGTGCDIFRVVAFTANHTGYLDATSSFSGVGHSTYRNSVNQVWHIGNGTTYCVTEQFAFKAANTAGYMQMSFDSTTYTARVGTAVAVTNATAATPSSANPDATWGLGGNPGAGFLVQALVPEVIMFNRVLSAADRAVVQAYMLSEYGLS
jgi:hypothetical protein